LQRYFEGRIDHWVKELRKVGVTLKLFWEEYKVLHHMPRNHQEWQRAQGFTGDHFRAQARKIGPATEWAMGQVLASRYNETQSYRSCMGVLSLVKKYGPDRLEAASARLRAAGKASYRRLTNVLKKKLDLPSGTPDLSPPPRNTKMYGDRRLTLNHHCTCVSANFATL
jgi:hypothetical protein